MTLNLANHNALQLPLEFVTERISFLARTGAGKSGGMRIMAEEMIRAGQFVVFLDPKGDVWGIRAACEGPDLAVLIKVASAPTGRPGRWEKECGQGTGCCNVGSAVYLQVEVVRDRRFDK